MRRILVALLFTVSAFAQSPRIEKIDPPNWWATMPAPMLLVKGENLTAAHFTLSDASLHINKLVISANGHYAQLWLSASPAHSQTIQINVRTPNGRTSSRYSFASRRSSSDSFAGFSSKDVMYLIMIDRFADGDPTNDGPDHAAELAKPRGWHGGDLRGITQHLDYLQQLGINTVWITPVYQNRGSQSYHGYGATDMYAVDDHFGTLADLKDLAAALHARHMKLVLDTVPNHIGPNHPWVRDSPDPTWFHGTLEHHTIAQGDFAPLTDPHAPWRDQHNVTEGWFANTLPDLNQEDPAVARYLTQNSIWWIEQGGLDGLRIDTFPYVARPFWQGFHAQLHALYPHLTTVGEVFNSDPTITSTFAGEVTRTGVDTGLDTPFDFPSYFALRDVFLKNAPMTRLADVLRLDNLYPHPERLIPFIGNHDTARFLNDPATTPRTLELAFTILTTMRGMPQIYSGDEIAMHGGEDPDNRRDFPGGFVPAPGAVQNDAFNPSSRTPEQQQSFATLQTLLALRRSHPALQTGDEQLLHADQNVLVYVRTLHTPTQPSQRILVAINKAAQPSDTIVNIEATALEGAQQANTLYGSSEATLTTNTLTLHLAPQTAAIFDLN
ncbi:alpha-amylase family glycosyl hydrolase [Tunturiibacter gelidoferens]|uniref:Glycosidase n=1 Tax=Tunturiibacter gelidiferens TaxID=3069689 RepID=A0ACC5NZT4_9BACT|nr:alpha-amylase family glycosyl hydrolase [Edaphobacter lichenicola]MBB5340112.1 glycosidase [Edaphobacter lichenicola]